MNFNKIKIKKDYLPFNNKMIELPIEDCHNLIFARNGTGKTTIAREIYENRDKESREDEKYSIFFNDTNPVDINEKEYIYVFGYDFFVNFNVENPLIYATNDINDVKEDIENTNKEIELLARQLARFGGSNSNPEATIARRLYDFGITSAKFDSKRKETFVEKGELGFLKELVNSDLYRNLKAQYRKSDGKYKYQRNLFDSMRTEREIETIKLLSKFPGFFELEEKVNSFEKRLQESYTELNKIVESARKPTEGFLDKINYYAARIFYSKDRLEFTKSRDKLYEVKSRGKKLDNLNQLSTAEQNIVNLIYFFSRILYEIEVNQVTQKVLIVLDDPIASTDFENKIGIYSFLREQIKILSKQINNFTCLIFTHDEEVYYHFNKLFSDLELNIKRYELSHENGLMQINSENNFYSKHITDIYLFALGYKKELQFYIGNVMRKVLEGYSTFNYCMGMEELSTSVEIKNELSTQEEKGLFDNFLYRLLLNSESHQSDNSKKTEHNRVDYFSIQEKQNTAKIVISLLYRLNPLYVERHIADFVEMSEDLKQFKKEKENKENRIAKYIRDIMNREKGIKSTAGEKQEEIKEKKLRIEEEKGNLEEELKELEKCYLMEFANDNWREKLKENIDCWLSI
ncbi:AAA family ATPase [Streptococcus oralis]|uniref:AAA family ATPase n=1 Tax=Streptococcus oralis TaxID=1303 RepID=UPI002001C7C5|nr:AAA family ATPase [Streptococcus oralis]